MLPFLQNVQHGVLRVHGACDILAMCVVSSMGNLMLRVWCATFGISHRLKPSVAGCPP